MYTEYEVLSGKRVVATRRAASAREAVADYAQSLGCRRDEIMWLGVNSVAWRGAVFRAQEVTDPSSA